MASAREWSCGMPTGCSGMVGIGVSPAGKKWRGEFSPKASSKALTVGNETAHLHTPRKLPLSANAVLWPAVRRLRYELNAVRNREIQFLAAEDSK